MSFGVIGTAVAGAVASNVVGGLFADDASGTLNQANTDANALQKYVYDSDVARNQPSIDARDRSLALLENGLGTTGLETKDQIRARIRAERMGQNSGGNQQQQQQSGVGNNSYVAPNALTPFGAQNNQDQDQQIRQALGLVGDNSSEAMARINAYRQSSGMAQLGQQQTNNNGDISDEELNALVDKEYATKQQQNGNIANGSLLKDFGKSDFEADPGYEFRKTEALKALERSGAARGSALSGGALKAITNYSQNLASDEYGKAYDRYNNNRTTKYNFLSNLAQLGQVGSTAVSNAGTNYANQVGNNITSTGSAVATGQLYNNQLNQRNATNSINRAIPQLGTAIPNWLESQRIAGYGGTVSDPWYG